MVALCFIVIACMRVVQSYCGKRASTLVNSRMNFFEYGAFYQFVSAMLAVITLCVSGFYGFDFPTAVCALLAAVLFAINLYANIEALKGATMVLCSMFAQGGLFVPCILGIFLFNEPMNIFQWLGLATFVVSAGLLAGSSNKENKKLTLRTVLMLFLDFLANGFVMVVQKYFAILVPNGNVAVYSFLTFSFNTIILVACAGCLFLFGGETDEGKRKYPYEKMDKKQYVFGALLGLAVFLINWLVTTLARTVPSVVLFPVSSAISLAITTAVGAIVYKEKITLKNLCGILLGLASIIVINVL